MNMPMGKRVRDAFVAETIILHLALHTFTTLHTMRFCRYLNPRWSFQQFAETFKHHRVAYGWEVLSVAIYDLNADDSLIIVTIAPTCASATSPIHELVLSIHPLFRTSKIVVRPFFPRATSDSDCSGVWVPDDLLLVDLLPRLRQAHTALSTGPRGYVGLRTIWNILTRESSQCEVVDSGRVRLNLSARTSRLCFAPHRLAVSYPPWFLHTLYPAHPVLLQPVLYFSCFLVIEVPYQQYPSFAIPSTIARNYPLDAT